MCRLDVPCIIQGPIVSAVFEEHILWSEGNAWYLLLCQMTLGHETLSSFIGDDTYVRNDSESARASLSASLIFFERWSSSCRVIRARILANCANMSKPKGALSPLDGFFFKDSSKRISFCFSLSFGTGVWTGTAAPDVVGWDALTGIWSYCCKYYLA